MPIVRSKANANSGANRIAIVMDIEQCEHRAFDARTVAYSMALGW
jgi:hypothetical protein